MVDRTPNEAAPARTSRLDVNLFKGRKPPFILIIS
jgi:hypothetical protein